jgi:predicted amidohydrolase
LEKLIISSVGAGSKPAPTNPKLIVLPEMFTTGFKFRKEVADSMNGETLQWMRKTAQTLNAAIYGSLLILENDKLYNRGFFIFPNGAYECYDKRHCFVMSDEPKYITPGTKIVTVKYAGWRLRLNICHDLRFPVWSRNRYENGHYEYDILLNVASWADSRAHIWRTLLHARAIENLAFCIGVNRVGQDGEGVNYRGDSMIVDAKGTALAMGNPNEEQAIFVQIKKTSLDEFRQKFNIGAIWDSYEIKL